MKRLTLGLIVLLTLSSVTANAAEIIAKICMDGQGSLTQKNDQASNTYNTQSGYGIAAEYLQQLTDAFSFGVGIEYQLARNVASSGQGQFSFVPIYATGQYRLFDAEIFKPYVKVNLEYNMMFIGE